MDKARLLYVDDEEINLRNFKMAFEEEYEVFTAASGDEALALFEREDDIAIVVVDQRMPGMTGVELLAKIFEMDQYPVRMILTAYTDEEDIIDAINRGHVYHYILKPWDENRLRVTLHRAGETYLLTKENKYLIKELEGKNRSLQEVNDELQIVNELLKEDIIERQQAEKALRESEERFRQIAENIKGTFWVRDAEGNQIYISPGYEGLFGRSCESLYDDPKSWLDAVHPDDHEAVIARHAELLSGPYEIIEYRVIRPDGSMRWVRSRSFPVCDESGKIYRETGFAEDITEYRRVLDKLEESEQRYRSFFETSIDGICVIQISGGKKRMIDCNASCAIMAGRNRTELLSYPDIKELQQQPEESMNQLSCGQKKTVKGQTCEGVFSWIRPDGRENYIECRGTPVTINNQTFNLCVHRDVTESRKVAKKIKDLSRRVIYMAEEERKRIARDLHDEFGQALLALRYAIEDIQKSLPPELAGLGTRFSEITGLVERLGDIARTVATALRPDMLDRLGLIPTIGWGVNDFAVRHKDTRIEFNVVGAQKDLAADIEIVLYRAFQEGLNNIAKHAAAKHISILLTFSHPHIILTMTDDGVGFDVDKIMGSSRSEESGIGLFGMQERVVSVNGTMTIRAHKGKGTMIRAKLPVSLKDV